MTFKTMTRVLAIAATLGAASGTQAAEGPGKAPSQSIADPVWRSEARPDRYSAIPIPSVKGDIPRTPGVARTAVDKRYDRVTGSAGFLCGRGPGHDEYGAGAASGVDPWGRFVGAKLSFAFR